MHHTYQHFTPNYYFRCNLNSCYLFGRYISPNGTHTSHPHIACRVKWSPIRVITPLYINKVSVAVFACWRRCCSPEYARATNVLPLLCLNNDCRAPMSPLISQLWLQFGNARLYSTPMLRGEGYLSQSCFQMPLFLFSDPDITRVSGIISAVFYTHVTDVTMVEPLYIRVLCDHRQFE